MRLVILTLATCVALVAFALTGPEVQARSGSGYGCNSAPVPTLDEEYADYGCHSSDRGCASVGAGCGGRERSLLRGRERRQERREARRERRAERRHGGGCG